MLKVKKIEKTVLRVNQLQEKMDERGIATTVLKLPENLVLFSLYWPRNGFSFLFVPAKGNPCIIAPYGEQDDPDEGIISEVKRFGWVKLEDGDPYVAISSILGDLKQKNRIPDESIIGTDLDANVIAPNQCCGELMPPGANTRKMLREVFQTEGLIEVTGIINEMRRVKTKVEVDKIGLANELGWIGINKFVELASEPGIREIDIAAGVESCVLRTASGYKDKVKFGRAFTQITSGPKRTEAAWFAGMVTTNRIIRNGDFVMIEMGLVADGFWCDLTKTVVCGTAASNKQKEMMFVIERSLAVALASIKEGITSGEIDQVARESIKKDGYGKYFVHILGHGVGIAYHDGEPYLMPGAQLVLKAGMVHSCEPGIYIPGIGGVRQEVNVLVMEERGQVLGEGSLIMKGKKNEVQE